jgi:predicted PurR-regulated permease PerM
MSVIQSNISTSAIVGIYKLLLAAFIIGVLYIGRVIFIPLALGLLLAFLLSPFVSRLERWIGRISAVLITVIIIFTGISTAGYILTHEFIDLTTKLPKYKNNIDVKLRSIHLPYIEGSALQERIQKFEKNLQDYLPITTPTSFKTTAVGIAGETEKAIETTTSSTTKPTSLTDRNDSKSYLTGLAQSFAGSLISFLWTIGLVMLFVIFILLYREDLRGRILRIVGQRRIGVSTQAIEDISNRISHYLFMQLIINLIYGIIVSISLYFIGIPNAELWGGLAIVLRFIPYIGSWIAAAIPIALSFVISATWWAPFLTLGLYLLLDLSISNFIEPFLYGSSTGVSSLALIVAAIFWTLLWGPIGLLLSTPLTVCLVVIGRYVPQLGFLNILFSDEQALKMYEECYHRLLTEGESHVMDVIDDFLKDNSLTSLYDTVLIPVILQIELDLRLEIINEEKGKELYQSIRDIIEDLNASPAVPIDVKSKAEIAVLPESTCRVICIPARAEQDGIVGTMLAQVLAQKSFIVENISANHNADEITGYIEKNLPDAICISVVAPSTVIYVRFLCKKLRMRMPELKIIVGLWGSSEMASEIGQKLRGSANETVALLSEAVSHIEKMCSSSGTR